MATPWQPDGGAPRSGVDQPPFPRGGISPIAVLAPLGRARPALLKAHARQDADNSLLGGLRPMLGVEPEHPGR